MRTFQFKQFKQFKQCKQCKQLALAVLFTVLMAPPADAGGILQPVADANGPYVVTIGDDLVLDGSGSVDSTFIDEWNWELSGDGLFDDASGEMVTLTAASNYGGFFGGPTAGPLFPVALQVVCNSCGIPTDSDTTTVSFVPEPAGALLLACALSAVAVIRRRRQP